MLALSAQTPRRLSQIRPSPLNKAFISTIWFVQEIVGSPKNLVRSLPPIPSSITDTTSSIVLSFHTLVDHFNEQQAREAHDICHCNDKNTQSFLDADVHPVQNYLRFGSILLECGQRYSSWESMTPSSSNAIRIRMRMMTQRSNDCWALELTLLFVDDPYGISHRRLLTMWFMNSFFP